MSEDKKLHNDEDNKIEARDTQESIEPKSEDVDNNTNEVKKEEKEKKGKNTKVIIIGVVASALCLTAGFSLGKSAGRKLPATSKTYSTSKVVATVGDVNITGKKLKQRMEPLFYLNGKNELSGDELKAYEQSMIDYMTTTEALYLAGKKAGVKVSEEDVESEYKSMMESITQNFGLDEEKFLKEFDLTKEDIKEDLEKELIATEYIARESDVTDEEAQNYYNKNKDEFLKVRASHILIMNQDADGKEVSEDQKKKNKEKADAILKRALAGEDFATLAKENSDDGSASNGGDLDFFEKGKMVEPFEKSAFALKVGEIDKNVVESDFGYHIIKKTDEKYEDYDTIKDDLKNKLSYEKQSNVVDNVLSEYKINVKYK